MFKLKLDTFIDDNWKEIESTLCDVCEKDIHKNKRWIQLNVNNANVRYELDFHLTCAIKFGTQLIKLAKPK